MVAVLEHDNGSGRTCNKIHKVKIGKDLAYSYQIFGRRHKTAMFEGKKSKPYTLWI